jgi:hypothetical protein
MFLDMRLDGLLGLNWLKNITWQERGSINKEEVGSVKKLVTTK